MFGLLIFFELFAVAEQFLFKISNENCVFWRNFVSDTIAEAPMQFNYRLKLRDTILWARTNKEFINKPEQKL